MGVGGVPLQRRQLLRAVGAQRRAVRVLAEVHHVRRPVAVAGGGERERTEEGGEDDRHGSRGGHGTQSRAPEFEEVGCRSMSARGGYIYAYARGEAEAAAAVILARAWTLPAAAVRLPLGSAASVTAGKNNLLARVLFCFADISRVGEMRPIFLAAASNTYFF